LFRAAGAGDQSRMTIATEPGCDVADSARRFLERARVDPRRANIVIQLAEAVGDRIDSLPGYIDMLLVVDGSPRGEHDKYLRWFAALGMLERSLLPRIRGLASALTADPGRGSCPCVPGS
jgi:hypothetical protein